MPTEGEQLDRLAEVLQHLGAPIERVLSAVSVSGMPTLHLGISALSQRMQFLMPIRPETLEIVAPGVQPPPVPQRGVVAMFVDGKKVRGSIMTLGATSIPEAIDEVAPAAQRDAWLAVTEPFVSKTGGVVMNRTRALVGQRAELAIAYPKRDLAEDARFIENVVQHGKHLGLSDEQQVMLRQAYAAMRSNEPLSVSTECTVYGPTAQVSVKHGHSEWDRAIDVLKVFTGSAEATHGAALLGWLSGVLDAPRPRGVEIVIGRKPDVIVWFAPKANS